jgi:hypothetical protein
MDGHAVIKLHYISSSLQQVAGYVLSLAKQLNFLSLAKQLNLLINIQADRAALGPAVYSASDRNGYQKQKNNNISGEYSAAGA